MKLQLIKPSIEYKTQLLTLKDSLTKENSRFQGTSNLNKYSSIKDWLEYLSKQESKDTCLEGLVPNVVYMLIDESDPNKDILGMIDIRLELNDYLYNFGGNIGYIINPKYRGNGYGNTILELGLLKCQELNLKKVLITCVDFNKASESIIRKNGGVLEDIRLEKDENVNLMRFYIDLSSPE